MVSPALVAEKLPRFHAQYYDFGSVTVRRTTPKSVELIRTGVPLATVEWFAALFGGYLEMTMRLAGAAAAEAISGAPTRTGRAHGIDVADVTITIRWA